MLAQRLRRWANIGSRLVHMTRTVSIQVPSYKLSGRLILIATIKGHHLAHRACLSCSKHEMFTQRWFKAGTALSQRWINVCRLPGVE